MHKYYYNEIAGDYSQKRKRAWKPLESYIVYLINKGHYLDGLSFDLGCANGRNFIIFTKISKSVIGIDNSIEFLKIARKNLSDSDQYPEGTLNKVQLILADMKFLPIRTNIGNNIFSIASFHHIKGRIARREFMLEIDRILKKNGKVLITVWRKWQVKYRKYFLLDKIKRSISIKYKKKQIKLGLKEFGDNYVPWTISGKNRIYERFYHFFSRRELKSSLNKILIEDIKKCGGTTQKDNYFIFASKKKKFSDRRLN